MQEIKPNDNKPLDPRPSRIARVIIVDDSAIVRQVLQVQLSRQPGVVVVEKVRTVPPARDW